MALYKCCIIIIIILHDYDKKFLIGLEPAVWFLQQQQRLDTPEQRISGPTSNNVSSAGQ